MRRSRRIVIKHKLSCALPGSNGRKHDRNRAASTGGYLCGTRIREMEIARVWTGERHTRKTERSTPGIAHGNVLRRRDGTGKYGRERHCRWSERNRRKWLHRRAAKRHRLRAARAIICDHQRRYPRSRYGGREGQADCAERPSAQGSATVIYAGELCRIDSLDRDRRDEQRLLTVVDQSFQNGAAGGADRRSKGKRSAFELR